MDFYAVYTSCLVDTVHRYNRYFGSLRARSALESPYSLKFTTVPIDTTPPYPVVISPQNGGKSSSQAYFEFIMDKPTNYSSFVSHILVGRFDWQEDFARQGFVPVNVEQSDACSFSFRISVDSRDAIHCNCHSRSTRLLWKFKQGDVFNRIYSIYFRSCRWFHNRKF